MEYKDKGILGILGSIFLARSVINTSNRFLYPFAPVISRGLGVPLTAVTSIIALNQATNLLGIFFSPLGDKTGYRRMMVTGLLFLIAGMLLASILPLYCTLVMAMFLSGLCKSFFDPAIQAYVGKRVSYRRRGMVVGILEISWSVSTLLGIPCMGFMINSFGWRSPFFVLAGSGIISLALVLIYIKNDFKQNSETRTNTSHAFAKFKNILSLRRVRGVIGVGFCMGFANDNLFVIYGAWLENTFSLSVVALGIGTGIIGIAELMGSSFTAIFSDRIGIKRSIVWGITLCSGAYLLLPMAHESLSFALTALFVVFLFFEQSIVAFISLCTELIADSRATTISLFIASSGIGRVTGALSGGLIWQRFGMETVCIISSVLTLAALVFFIWGTRGWTPE